jgi:hypothetical protein
VTPIEYAIARVNGQLAAAGKPLIPTAPTKPEISSAREIAASIEIPPPAVQASGANHRKRNRAREGSAARYASVAPSAETTRVLEIERDREDQLFREALNNRPRINQIVSAWAQSMLAHELEENTDATH